MKSTLLVFLAALSALGNPVRFGGIDRNAMIVTNGVTSGDVVAMIGYATEDHLGMPNPHNVTADQVGALTPTWATTGTVGRSVQLMENGGASSVTMGPGTAMVNRVSHDWTRLVAVSSPEDAPSGPQAYPPTGTVFVLSTKWAQFFSDYAPYYESQDGNWAISGMVGLDSYWHWAAISAQPGWNEGSNHTWWLGRVYTPGEVMATISGGWPYPDFVVSPAPVTNSIPLVTKEETGIMISGHNDDETAHPSLLRSAGGTMDGLLTLSESGLRWQGAGIATNYTIKAEYDGTNLSFNVYMEAKP